MAVQVSDVLSRVKTILQDENGVRWPEPELLGWLNDGQREVVMLAPQSNSVTATIELVEGSRQSIPTDGIQLLRVIRNIGGKVIRQTQRSLLDSQLPLWHEVEGEQVVHYTFDPLEPRVFYVYPHREELLVEISYVRAPDNVDETGAIALPDIYANALVDYVLYRAYSKDAEEAANRELSVTHYTRFVESLGMKAQVDGVTAMSQNNIARPPSGA